MNDAPIKEEYAVVLDFLAILGSVAGLVLGIGLACGSSDSVMALHGLLIGAACGTALLFLLGKGLGDGTLSGANDKPERPAYSDTVIKAGVIATVFWGIAGFIVGDLIAWQRADPVLNLDLPWTSLGRLRPLHPSAVIFAFAGNALIATSFYVVQRICRARLAGRWAPWFVFWGYNLFIAIVATGYVLGVTPSKEYAEPEWYADLWLTIVWVIYLLVFLGTLARRKEPHLYLANWFYLSVIVTVAMPHMVSNLAIPVSINGTDSDIAYSSVRLGENTIKTRTVSIHLLGGGQ
jgi:cytochrome c oxidase cbb3-type subunit 1